MAISDYESGEEENGRWKLVRRVVNASSYALSNDAAVTLITLDRLLYAGHWHDWGSRLYLLSKFTCFRGIGMHACLGSSQSLPEKWKRMA